jgi:flagellar protein FlgJ
MTVAINDFAQFTRMRSEADQNDPAALREVARQFEALFLETILKNMRAAEISSPIFGDSDQMKMYREMTDQQLAINMTEGSGIGFADMLVRQLGGDSTSGSAPTSTANFLLSAVPRQPSVRRSESAGSLPAAATPVAPLTHSAPVTPGAPASRSPGRWTDPASFVRELWPHAERVARRLDVAPEGIVAQAALETGWGAHVIEGGDGGSSHNLFGIKAGGDWDGDSVSRSTLEYADGIAQRRVDQFRAYGDISATFDDYTRLIEGDQRYSEVRGKGQDVAGFATALQEAGYATDPLYAAKIVRVLHSETMQAALGELKNP